MANQLSALGHDVLESILEDIRTRPREYWLEFLEHYENEQEGDFVFPIFSPSQTAVQKPVNDTEKAKKPSRSRRKAA